VRACWQQHGHILLIKSIIGSKRVDISSAKPASCNHRTSQLNCQRGIY